MLECFPSNIRKPQVQTEVIFSTHPQVKTTKHANVGEESLLPCKSQKHIHYNDFWISLPNPLVQPKRAGPCNFRVNYLKHTSNISMSLWNIVTPPEALENKHCAEISPLEDAARTTIQNSMKNDVAGVPSISSSKMGSCHPEPVNNHRLVRAFHGNVSFWNAAPFWKDVNMAVK